MQERIYGLAFILDYSDELCKTCLDIIGLIIAQQNAVVVTYKLQNYKIARTERAGRVIYLKNLRRIFEED